MTTTIAMKRMQQFGLKKRNRRSLSPVRPPSATSKPPGPRSKSPKSPNGDRGRVVRRHRNLDPNSRNQSSTRVCGSTTEKRGSPPAALAEVLLVRFNLPTSLKWIRNQSLPAARTEYLPQCSWKPLIKVPIKARVRVWITLKLTQWDTARETPGISFIDRPSSIRPRSTRKQARGYIRHTANSIDSPLWASDSFPLFVFGKLGARNSTPRNLDGS